MTTELEPKQKRNAARMIAALTCTKLGDVLINPKTVLTWLLTQMGVSGWVISLLVPIRESGSMLPQLLISGWVKRFSRRKHVYVGGALAQALAVAGIGCAALFVPPAIAGVAVLIGLALFAVSRAFCSISNKDVLGRIVGKGYRGRVGGISATVSGVVSTIAALVLITLRDDAEARLLAWIVLGAALLWLIGALFYSRIDEPAEEPDENAESRDVLGRVGLVWDDRLFRRFIIARILLLGSALASPLLVVLAGSNGGTFKALGGFVIASGIASFSSSFLWGRLSDYGSHLAMCLGGLVSAGIGALALGIAWASPAWAGHELLWPLLFLLFNIGYSGVRIGRKTWVVDAADGDQRTDYVSVSNTIISIAIIGLGVAASPLQVMSPLIPLAGYTVLCVAGAFVALLINPNRADN